MTGTREYEDACDTPCERSEVDARQLDLRGGDGGNLDATGTRFEPELLGKGIRATDESLDDLILRHGLNNLASNENLSLTVAGSNAEVCLSGLARPVDNAAHDSNAQRNGQVLQALGHVLVLMAAAAVQALYFGGLPEWAYPGWMARRYYASHPGARERELGARAAI